MSLTPPRKVIVEPHAGTLFAALAATRTDEKTGG